MDHSRLADIYLKLSSSSEDPVIALSFLLKAIEEMAMHKIVEESGQDIFDNTVQKKIMEKITEDEKLYSGLDRVLTAMFMFLQNENGDNIGTYIESIIKDLSR
ncbi:MULTISPECIES: hypothetical protein [Acidianus]|uniref:Uncharacterized protein n=1 Tax=Candidatus Acidianus copahuensis TaxID=1160895 RepID=A0A031LLJ8_9CREN|nr:MULTISPECIES: hypothetical protein [Acidianus]EZQ02109.1 hypothetical protein CM19_10855 [Candidatus Acidianus copahuensis]NON62680.1 hypothetical protein [Acidianus sp. RZ1]